MKKKKLLLNTTIVIAFFLMAASCGQKGPLPSADTIPPSVVQIYPNLNTSLVPINTSVSIVFNKDMNSSSTNTATISLSYPGGGNAPGSVDCLGNTVVFTPMSPLSDNTLYSLSISGSVESSTGVAMGTPYASSFSTGTTSVISTITATAGPNGTITPSGAVKVNYYGSQTFTITAKQGYTVYDVQVNGVHVGLVTSYTFNQVIPPNQTISASFGPITGSGGSGGP